MAPPSSTLKCKPSDASSIEMGMERSGLPGTPLQARPSAFPGLKSEMLHVQPLHTPLPADKTPARGLSSDVAARRLASEGPNLLPGSAPKSTATIVRDVVTEPMFLMLLAAGGK